MSTETEVAELTKVVREEGQEDLEYFGALISACRELSDDDWGTLSEPCQLWVNVCQFLVDQDKPVLPPTDKAGIKEVAAEMKAADAAAEEAKKEKEAAKETKKAKKVQKEAKEASPTKKEKVVKTAATAKKAGNGKTKAKDGEDGAGRGRKGSFPLSAKIVLKTKDNPHRKGTTLYKMFDKYKSGMTVQQALDAGVVWANLRYLASLEHIKIG